MAIAKRTVGKENAEQRPVLDAEPGKETLMQDEPELEVDASGEAVLSPRGSTPLRLFTGSLGRLRGSRAAGGAARHHQEIDMEFPPVARPSDVEKMGYVSPVYSLSRSVRLNPRVMLANRCVAFLQDSPEVEFYRQLRTRILQLNDSEAGATVMITSALPGEGKTLTAINLALTFAKEFKQTALLVDCDLRQQQVHSVMGFPSERGLVDYLMHDCPVTELFVWPSVEKLSVISGGKTVKDSCELLGSPGMRDLVYEMKHRYPDRYIFFDAPSILTSADAVAFAPLVDYVLVVAQAGQTSLADINRAVQLLPPEKVLGLVMNQF